MLTLAQVLDAHTDLAPGERAWLGALVAEWEILADLSFSDLILWVPDVDDNVFWAAAQFRPTTGPTALEDDVVGDVIAYDPESLVTAAYMSREITETSFNSVFAGIPVGVQAIPIIKFERVVGVVEMHTNQMGVRAPGALEDAYLEAAQILSEMVWLGHFPLVDGRPVPGMSPRVGDGVIRVGSQGNVVYASPNAVSAYRRMGLAGDLEGENFAQITASMLPGKGRAPVEQPLATILAGRGSHEVELENPTASVRLRVVPMLSSGKASGVLVMCRDTTEVRSRERQLVTKDATIREIHHRVKNNLQTVAALLRLQARRIDSVEAKLALADATKRIGAIAVVHEILSQAFDTTVEFDAVADRLMALVVEAGTTPDQVRMRRIGSFERVPAEVATSLALILTELCQNAVEHGFGPRRGEVLVRPSHQGQRLVMEVVNDGEPLASDFVLEQSRSLGLSIVRTLVGDLGGIFSLTSADADKGVIARVEVPLG